MSHPFARLRRVTRLRTTLAEVLDDLDRSADADVAQVASVTSSMRPLTRGPTNSPGLMTTNGPPLGEGGPGRSSSLCGSPRPGDAPCPLKHVLRRCGHDDEL